MGEGGFAPELFEDIGGVAAARDETVAEIAERAVEGFEAFVSEFEVGGVEFGGLGP